MQTNAADLGNKIYDSAIAEHYKWAKAEYVSPQQAEQIYTEAMDVLQSYIRERAAFMNSFLSPAGRYVIYMRNGQSVGTVLDAATYMPSDTATAMENSFETDAQFTGWNTKADGSGTAYMPGDTITIGSEDVVLYAQWEGQTASSAQQQMQSASLLAKIKTFFRKFF